MEEVWLLIEEDAKSYIQEGKQVPRFYISNDKMRIASESWGRKTQNSGIRKTINYLQIAGRLFFIDLWFYQTTSAYGFGKNHLSEYIEFIKMIISSLAFLFPF